MVLSEGVRVAIGRSKDCWVHFKVDEAQGVHAIQQTREQVSLPGSNAGMCQLRYLVKSPMRMEFWFAPEKQIPEGDVASVVPHFL